MNLVHVRKTSTGTEAGGLARWLLEKWKGVRRGEPSLALVERIQLAPRQSLSLVEAEGQRFLVATSAEGAPAFYPLAAKTRGLRAAAKARVSW